MYVLTLPLAKERDYLSCARLEARLRLVSGVQSACIKNGVLRLGIKKGTKVKKLTTGLSLVLGRELVRTSKSAVVTTAKTLSAKPAAAAANTDIKAQLAGHKRDALISVAGFAAFEIMRRYAPTLFASTTLIRAAAVLLMSRSLLKSGIVDAVAERRPNAETLTVTAVISSVLAGKPESSLTLLALSNFAEMLTIMAAQKARANISNLLALDVQEAWVVGEDGRERRVHIDLIKPGMTISIHSGEKICVDGVVSSGSAAVDQAAITGESVPVTKNSGDKVFAGSNIRLGEIEVLVQKVGDDTSLSRIVHMVEDAQTRRAPIQNYADHMASALVPVSFIAALVVYAATRDWQRVLNMLFIDFSCGLKLSTATAMSAAISRAAREGILVKGGSFIEAASRIDTIVLDKTGTITSGRPEVVSISVAEGFSEDLILKAASSAEMHSSHPMAAAILDTTEKRGLETPEHIDTATVIARGIRAQLPAFDDYSGGEVLVGSLIFMQEQHVEGLDLQHRLSSPTGSLIYIAMSGRLAGILEISDPIRQEFRRTINRLRFAGVEEIVMLTGDNRKAAEAIARSLGLDDFRAEVMPEDKATYVSEKKRTGSVLMVGDGINDAPALAYADIGVAMGTACTDTAMESADVTINSEDPLKLPEFIAIGRRTMHLVHQNFTVTIAVNTAAMMLGALGIINPLLASVVHNASTLGVVLNSARVLAVRDRRN